MIKLKNILSEILTEGAKFGYVKLQLDASSLKEFQDQISKDDLDTKGFETDPHVTLLYGLHPEVTDQQVKEKLDKVSFGSVSGKNVSLFTGGQEVLKLDAEGSGLIEANKALRELPHTSDFPDFHPHITIAFLKKGLGQKYVDMFKGKSLDLKAGKIIYKNAGKQEFTIK